MCVLILLALPCLTTSVIDHALPHDVFHFTCHASQQDLVYEVRSRDIVKDTGSIDACSSDLPEAGSRQGCALLSYRLDFTYPARLEGSRNMKVCDCPKREYNGFEVLVTVLGPFHQCFHLVTGGHWREKTVKELQLWLRIRDAQLETITPYFLHKDHAEKKSNRMKPTTVHCSSCAMRSRTTHRLTKLQCARFGCRR